MPCYFLCICSLNVSFSLRVIEVISMFQSNCLISCRYDVNMAIINISKVRHYFTFTDIDF